MRQSTKKLLHRRSRGARPPVPQASFARYDALTAEEVLAHLGELTPVALARLGEHERAHQNRTPVLAGIDALLDNEPWPGYDTLDVTAVRAALDGAGDKDHVAVLAYERAHKHRAEVLLAAQQHRAEPPS